MSNRKLSIHLLGTIAIKNFVERILRSTFKSQDKMELLDAKSKKNPPILFAAIENCEREVVKFFVEAVFNSSLRLQH